MPGNWKSFKNILCVRTDNMGDVLMTSPAIKALKEDVPGRKITLLTSGSGKSAIKMLPFIDDVMVYEFPWMNKNSSAEILNDAIMDIEKRDFDAAIIFNVYSQNPLPAAMLCKQAGISQIAGYCRENPYGLITDWLPDREPLFEIRHEVQRQLNLVRALGVNVKDERMRIQINKEVKKTVGVILEKEGFKGNKKYIIIHPGVSERKRQFSIKVLTEAAEDIFQKTHFQILLTGVDSEKDLTSFIKNRVPSAIDLCGRLTIEQMCAIMQNASLLISNNTGPVHIASALATPVLVLYALTNPQHMPWRTEYKALTFEVPAELKSKNTIIEFANQKAFKHIPGKISADDIVSACLDLLEFKGKQKETDILQYD